MTTPKQGPVADTSVDSFLLELNREFGPDAAKLNKKFHAKNPQIEAGRGKAPERLNPEDSSHYRAVAKVTHVVVQECQSCSDVVDFIGGEYVEFKSVTGRLDHPRHLRPAAQCSNLFLFGSLEAPLEDLVEWHYQKVSRCPGCIRVDQQAQAIMWDQELRAAQAAVRNLPLDFDLGGDKAKDEEPVVNFEEEESGKAVVSAEKKASAQGE